MNFESAMFQPCKEWMASEKTSGKTWDELEKLGVSSAEFDSQLNKYIDELGWPEELDIETWMQFVSP